MWGIDHDKAYWEKPTSISGFQESKGYTLCNPKCYVLASFLDPDFTVAKFKHTSRGREKSERSQGGCSGGVGNKSSRDCGPNWSRGGLQRTGGKLRMDLFSIWLLRTSEKRMCACRPMKAGWQASQVVSRSHNSQTRYWTGLIREALFQAVRGRQEWQMFRIILS